MTSASSWDDLAVTAVSLRCSSAEIMLGKEEKVLNQKSNDESRCALPSSNERVAAATPPQDGRFDDRKLSEKDEIASSDELMDDKHDEITSLARKKTNRKGRHGARNQHRHKHFVKWLVQTFPQLSDTTTKNHVLDVAGGKGETAARLVFCHLQKVVMVDPRQCDLAACFESQVLPKLPKKWQQKCESQMQANPQYIQELVDSRFRQLVTTFDETTLATCAEIQDLVQNASLLIGLHADGATEAIVDAALQCRKPFVVVPCCVFPSLFSRRSLTQPDGTNVQVRSHEQFCQYLLAKDPRFVREVLPFEGRNVAIWWDGGYSIADSSVS